MFSSRHCSLAILVVVAALSSGCFQYQYTHGIETVRIRELHDNGRQDDHRASISTNEILLTDGGSGIGCAALATSANRTGNMYEAAYRAEREGRTTAEYSYRIYSPAEFRAISCGGYFRSGRGDGFLNLPFAPMPGMPAVDRSFASDSEMWEIGLYLGGAEGIVPEWPWLRWSMDVRLGVGDYKLTPRQVPGEVVPDKYVGDPYFTMPIHVGLLAFPEFLYGAGVHVYAGADPITWLIADPGKFYEQLDFGARLQYGYGLPAISFSAFFGWDMRNVGWTERWVQTTGWQLGGNVQIMIDEIIN